MSNAGAEFPPIDWTNVPIPSGWRGAYPPTLQKAKYYPSAFHQGQINVCRREGLHVQAEYHLAIERNRAAKIGKQNHSLERRHAELKAYARKKQAAFNYNAERKAVIAAAVAKFTADNPVPNEHDQDFYDAFFADEDDDEIDAIVASAAIVIPPGNGSSAASSSAASSAAASGAAASSVSASASSGSASDADEGLGSSQGQPEEEEESGDSGGLRRSSKRPRRN